MGNTLFKQMYVFHGEWFCQKGVRVPQNEKTRGGTEIISVEASHRERTKRKGK
jgi:hypothetical protein